MKIFRELKRRQVFQVAAAYLVIAWAVLEAGDLLFDALEVPSWGVRLLLGLLLLGFPIALFFSWIYQVDSDGIRRETDLEEDLPAQPIADLTAVARQSGKPIPEDLSVAVLAFEDLSADRDQEYFGDGISEEILNLLARVDSLRVIARTSSFSFKNKNMTVEEIAGELGVAYVLEGSIRKAGNRIRITAQLIQAKDSSHLFSESYDRQLADVFEVQDEIAGEVTANLKVRLLKPAPTESHGPASSAHDLYLQGTHQLWKGTLKSLHLAIDLFAQATEIDPEYADAYALLSYGHMLSCADPQADRGLESALPLMRSAAEKAMELNPDSDQSNLSMAMFKMAVKEWRESEQYFLRSLSINPSYALACGYYGYFLANTRRMDQGLLWSNRAIELDPLNAHELCRKAQLSTYNGDPDTALKCAMKALEVQPGYGTAYLWKVSIYASVGKLEESLDAMRHWNLVDLRPTEEEIKTFKNALHEDDIMIYIRCIYDWLCKKQKRGARSPHLPFFLGLYAILVGHTEEAMDHFEMAWRQTMLVPDLPYYEPIKELPRWQAMLDKCGLNDADIDDLKRYATEYKQEIGFTLEP